MLANVFSRVPSHSRNEESIDAIFVTLDGVVRQAQVQNNATLTFAGSLKKEEQNGIHGTRY